MPAIEHFDEDLHAARNGYGDNENGLDLFGMPEPYTYDELLDMAATMADYEPQPCVTGILLKRLCDLRLDKADAKRNSQEWLLINGQIGLLEAVKQDLAQAA